MDGTLDADRASDTRRLTGSTKEEAGANRPGLCSRRHQEMPLVSRRRVARHNSALAKPLRAIAKAMGITKRVSPKAMRRSFQDAMREAQAANVVVRSISGHLTEQMHQRYSTYFPSFL